MFDLATLIQSVAATQLPELPPNLNLATFAKEVSHLLAPKVGTVETPDLPNRLSYLRLTTRCNMLCPHCCFNCTEKGEDMTPDIFRRALDIAIRRNLPADHPQAIVSERPPILTHDRPFPITISGGEPLLHPKFWSFIRHAKARLRPQDFGLQVFTNGSITGSALLLAKLAKRGELFAAVSMDQFHEPIADEVVEAFSGCTVCDRPLLREEKWNPETKRWNADLRAILDLSGDLRNEGRTQTLNGVEKKNECLTPEWIFDPNGEIRFCGCEDSPVIGDVWRGVDPKYLQYPSNVCYQVASAVVMAQGMLQNFFK